MNTIKSLKTIMLAAVASLAGFVASASDYYLKTVSSDWSLASSFTTTEGGSAEPSNPPGSSDTVYIPTSGETVLTDGTASFTTASGVSRVQMRDGAKLVLNVSSASPVTFAAEICDGNQATARAVYGTVVKRGLGEVRLTAGGSWSYYVHFSIEAGALRFAPASRITHVYYGDMDIADDAILYFPNANYARFRSFNGTSGAQAVSDIDNYDVMLLVTDNQDIWQATSQRDSVFAGKLVGSRLKVYTTHRLSLTGTQSTFNSVLSQYNRGEFSVGTNGYIAASALGAANTPSSVGNGGWIYFGAGGSGLKYLGTGETCNRYIGISEDTKTDYDSFLDGGATGGLELTGEFRNMSKKMQNFHLLGENATPCVFNGDITENPYYGDRPIFFTKSGGGVWSFKDKPSASRNGLYGGFAVEEGTLRFDTLSNRNEMCSLGTARVLTLGKTKSAPEASDSVDYAYTIGTTDSDREAVFEYVGSQCAVSTNRKAVVVGTGTIRSSATGTGWLGFCGGVTARDAGTATLVLDGTNENDNLVWNLADGGADRTLNVEKRGSGVWKLSGDQFFTGSLKVREGTLKLAGSKYSWYRFTVRETGEPSAYPGVTCFYQLALHDAEGERQNVGLTTPATDLTLSGTSYHRCSADWRSLKTGSAMIGGELWYTVSANQFVDELFTDSQVSPFSVNTVKNVDGTATATAFSKNDETTWLPIVMHLSDDANEIAAYDFTTYFTSTVYKRWPKLVRLEGSVDGINWTFIEDRDVDSTAAQAKYNVWISDASAFSTGQNRKGKGFMPTGIGRASAAQPLATVGYVSVSEGAVLKTLDPSVELSKIEIDCADCGTFDGFTISSGTGVMNLRNLDEGAVAALPDCFANVTNLAKLENWTVTIDGRKSGKRLRVKGNRVSVSPLGVVTVFR